MRRFGEQVTIEGGNAIAEKRACPGIAALRDLMRQSGHDDASETSHENANSACAENPRSPIDVGRGFHPGKWPGIRTIRRLRWGDFSRTTII